MFNFCARVAELADALDLGSSGITVGVQLPPLAPLSRVRTQLSAGYNIYLKNFKQGLELY